MVVLIVSQLAIPFAPVAGGHIGLTADYRFHPVFLGFLVELNGPKHVAMIGHGDGRHTKGTDLLEKGIKLICAVEETILSMEVKMNELRGHSLFPSLQNSNDGLKGSQRTPLPPQNVGINLCINWLS